MVLHPNQKLACLFSAISKIINTFFKNASDRKLSKELKNSIKI